jgi:predicted nucleic acid-binding Zn ribbon protein
MRVELIRKRVLEDWRGLPEETPSSERCVLAADALKRLVRRLGLAERIDERAIQSAWREIVGPFLADHSRPVSIRNGILFVQVIQPAVRYELESSWKRNILGKLQARFPKTVREVRFGG